MTYSATTRTETTADKNFETNFESSQLQVEIETMKLRIIVDSSKYVANHFSKGYK